MSCSNNGSNFREHTAGVSHTMAGADRRRLPPSGLGLGLVGLLPANRAMPFRPIDEDRRRQGVGVAEYAPQRSITNLLRRPAATPKWGQRLDGPDQIGPKEPPPLPLRVSASIPGVQEGHEGIFAGGTSNEPAAKKRKSAAEILGRARIASGPSFGSMDRLSYEQFPLCLHHCKRD